MSEIAYSDERREAFLAFSLLHGADAALDRCAIDAARRWFSEKITKRERWAVRCFAFGGADVALLAVYVCLSGREAVFSELGTVGTVLGGIALAAGIIILKDIEKHTLVDMSQTQREDILSHFFMSDAELAEVEAAKAEDERREREQAETVLARFNDTVSAEGFGNERTGA